MKFVLLIALFAFLVIGAFAKVDLNEEDAPMEEAVKGLPVNGARGGWGRGYYGGRYRGGYGYGRGYGYRGNYYY